MNFRGHVIDPIKVAWAAGFLDGEGCFIITMRRGGIFTPLVSVGQKSNLPLNCLSELFGGNYHQQGSGMWRWEICGALALREFLPLVIPFLVLKKDQAELLLEYAESIESSNGGRKLLEAEVQRRKKIFICLSEMKHEV